MSHRLDFERDGYLILEGFYPAAQIDVTLHAIGQKLAERPREIIVDLLESNRRTSLADLDRAAPLPRMKVNDLFLEMRTVRELALNERLSPILEGLLGQAPLLCNSLYFEQGSAQPKHIDSLYMTPVTPGHLIAIWVAMEDVHEDAGPLEHFPGSHRIEPMKFSNGSYHAINDEMAQWNAYIEQEIGRLQLRKETFLARKGDVFIWHSNYLHGGGQIRDRQRTRKSLVFHYFSLRDGQTMKCPKEAAGGGFWLRRQHQPIPIPVPVNPRPGVFSESTYLARYPDVAAAVASGQFSSGLEHYELFGSSEGRSGS